ncbi:MAG: hypothetical protein Q8R82_21360 [Hyphomonadaceae bacterium]|nr:hypothetical protein [Hyphomonadaceae bacterium]
MPEWPDWRGKSCAIIASGPSVKKAEVELLRDRLPVLAIKKSMELAPWAEVVYGCDYAWWRSVRGLPNFKGLRLAYAPRACDQFGCGRVLIPEHAKSDALRFGDIGTVGGGGNSGFQALNLAAQFGATRVLLLGFDCQDRSGVHWYGRNSWNGGSNPGKTNFSRWIKAFANAAKDLSDRGVEVINASPISEIKAFKKQNVADTLKEWGL